MLCNKAPGCSWAAGFTGTFSEEPIRHILWLFTSHLKSGYVAFFNGFIYMTVNRKVFFKLKDFWVENHQFVLEAVHGWTGQYCLVLLVTWFRIRPIKADLFECYFLCCSVPSRVKCLTRRFLTLICECT